MYFTPLGNPRREQDKEITSLTGPLIQDTTAYRQIAHYLPPEVIPSLFSYTQRYKMLKNLQTQEISKRSESRKKAITKLQETVRLIPILYRILGKRKLYDSTDLEYILKSILQIILIVGENNKFKNKLETYGIHYYLHDNNIQNLTYYTIDNRALLLDDESNIVLSIIIPTSVNRILKDVVGFIPNSTYKRILQIVHYIELIKSTMFFNNTSSITIEYFHKRFIFRLNKENIIKCIENNKVVNPFKWNLNLDLVVNKGVWYFTDSLTRIPQIKRR